MCLVKGGACCKCVIQCSQLIQIQRCCSWNYDWKRKDEEDDARNQKVKCFKMFVKICQSDYERNWLSLNYHQKWELLDVFFFSKRERFKVKNAFQKHLSKILYKTGKRIDNCKRIPPPPPPKLFIRKKNRDRRTWDCRLSECFRRFLLHVSACSALATIFA